MSPENCSLRALRLAELVSRGEFCDAIAVEDDGVLRLNSSQDRASASCAKDEACVPVVRILLAAASPVLAKEMAGLAPKSKPQAEVRLASGITAGGLRCVLAYACGVVPPAWSDSIMALSLSEVRAAGTALQVPHLEEWWSRQQRLHTHDCKGRPGRALMGRRQNLLLVCACVFLVLACCYAWMPALAYDFMENAQFMDDAMVYKNPNVFEPIDWHRILRTDYWGLEMFQPGVWTHKSFRPLTVLTFHFSYQLHGFTSSGWHIANILLHVLSSALLAAFGVVAGGLSIGWSAMLFALFLGHPVHTESVLYIVGRADLLCCVLVLLAALLYAPCISRSGPRTLLAMCYKASLLLLSSAILILAGLSKETGFCFFGLLVGCEALRAMLLARQHGEPYLQRAMRVLLLLVLGSVACYVRVWYTAGTEIERMDPQSNPIAGEKERHVRILSYSLVHGLYAKLLVWPTFLCYDYSMDAVPLVREFEDVRLLLPLASYCGLLQLLCFSMWPLRQEWLKAMSMPLGRTLDGVRPEVREGPVIGLAIVVLSFLPMSNILFPVGTLVGERLLYIPSAGLLLTLCALGQHAASVSRRRWANPVMFVAIAVAAGFVWLTAMRVPDWASARSITVADGMKQTRSSRVQFNYANVHLKEKRYDEALLTYQRAIGMAADDRDALPLYHAGQILIYQQRNAEAEAYLQQAVSGFYSPLTVKEEEIFHDYALALWFSDKAQASVENFHKSLTMNPVFTKSLNNLGCASGIGALSGKLPGDYLRYGLQMLDQAVQLEPTNVLYWRNAIALLQRLGDQKGAETAWQQLLTIDPASASAGAPAECTWEFYFR